MPYDVPYPRLLAEVEAWPLASAPVLTHGVVRMVRESIGGLDQQTKLIADALESHIRLRAGGMSLASLSALRDLCWFGEDSKTPSARSEVELVDYLLTLSREYISRAGPRIVVRAGVDSDKEDVADRIAHWRWLSLRLPADLLISALYADDGTPPSDRVSLSTMHLERTLRQPVAETHLHAGAAFDFSVQWTSWMVWLVNGSPDPSKIRFSEAHPFQNGAGLRSYLLAAAISRVLLAAFLWRRESSALQGTFSQFVAGELRHICGRINWPSGSAHAWKTCAEALTMVARQVPLSSFERGQRLYAALVRESRLPRVQSFGELLAADPLAAWVSPRANGACAETLFATRALRYLLREGRVDPQFAEIFWQYTHVRCLAHLWLVQEPGTAGLDWFGRHYERLSALRGPLDELRYEAAFRHQSIDIRLRALEVRTSPESSWIKNRDELRRLAHAACRYVRERKTEPPEVGLIFHFLKKREHRRLGQNRLHADPSADPTGFRFGVWFRQRRREATALVTALRYHPQLLVLLRGLDVASSELAIPTWVVAPLFRLVREFSEKSSSVLSWQQPTWRATPLNATCHAGEEFSRLVEGLRRVHELIESGIIHNGDRVGHGLALGRSPSRWAATASVVVQPKEDRLEDLIWELDRYARAEVQGSGARIEKVRAEASLLAHQIYGDAFCGLDILRAARSMRLQPETLERLGFPLRLVHPKTSSSSEKILQLQLTDVGVFLRGQEMVRVHVDDGEVDFLSRAQRWLCSSLARLEVTVESNPSSNMLIGDLLSMEEHPILQMAGISAGPSEVTAKASLEMHSRRSQLMVSVNSDDPITFATSLADEYAYVYFGLLRRGASAAEALEWINARREQGMLSRFTLEASADAHVLGAIASRRFARAT